MLRGTANSGAVFCDGDATSARIVAECKDGYGDAITFPYTHLQKIKAQALAKRAPYWMRFVRNDRGDRVVSMNYEFAELLMQIAHGKIKCECGNELEIDW